MVSKKSAIDWIGPSKYMYPCCTIFFLHIFGIVWCRISLISLSEGNLTSWSGWSCGNIVNVCSAYKNLYFHVRGLTSIPLQISFLITMFTVTAAITVVKLATVQLSMGLVSCGFGVTFQHPFHALVHGWTSINILCHKALLD